MSAPLSVASLSISSSSSSSSLPTVLILGGCGFIGRHLVAYLVSRSLASRITIADKTMPAIANMSDEHKAYFNNKDIVVFKQADLTKDAHVSRVFPADASYDYIFNLCGETRFGLLPSDYHTRCVDVATKVTKAAAALKGVKKFVEISTGQVYKADKSPSDETCKLKPWTVQATERLQAETIVKDTKGLPWVILRPAIVYGAADLTGLTPRLACASVYQSRKEKMQFLWNADLKINVVHVEDVARAMWIAATAIPVGSIYNLADQVDLNQGVFNGYLTALFGIETSFLGVLISSLAKLNLEGVAEEANDKHVPGYVELCRSHKILNTPISPYIDMELLRDNHVSINGTKITRDTSFKYERQISLAEVRTQVQAAIDMQLFPAVMLPAK